MDPKPYRPDPAPPRIVYAWEGEVAALRAENERLRGALGKLLFWNEGIRDGRGNHHARDHIRVIQDAQIGARPMEPDDNAELTMMDEVRELQAALDSALNENERLRGAGDAAFMAMCNQRDGPDAEVFQDAIDALGTALK